MSTPFASAANAYGNAARLIADQGAGKTPALTNPSQGADFGELLSQQLNAVVDAGRASDQVSVQMVNGEANVVDVVTALAETEIAMETMVTVRDRVISAYEEIMRMPI